MRRVYEDGYWGKIEYWVNEVVIASKHGELQRVEKATESLSYFVGRQIASLDPPEKTAEEELEVLREVLEDKDNEIQTLKLFLKGKPPKKENIIEKM